MDGSRSAPDTPLRSEEAAGAPQAKNVSGGSRVVRSEEGVPKAPRVPNDLVRPEPSMGVGSSSSIEIALDADADGTPRPRWASLPPPAKWFGRYGILGRLAVGGMAEIYLAREAIQGQADAARHMVIKVLRPGQGTQTEEDESYFEAMFLREGRVAMQLAHPNICHTYEFGKWGGHFFIAMEWVEGLPVRDLLQRVAKTGQPMPMEVAVYIVAQVAAALDYAHGARDSQRRPLGVVHRDVTPHNIMLRYDGVVKLLDFGVAKAEENEEASSSGTVKGKFGYMAPEQCAGRSMDGRADIFALGVCLYEMLTGKRLYQRGGQYETFRAIIEEPPPSVRDVVPELPEALDAIVQRMLAKSAVDRYDQAGDVQEAIVRFASSYGLVMSATKARRWLEELYGEDLFRGPTLELDSGVLNRLTPVQSHPPLSSSTPPATAFASYSKRPDSTSSRVALRISSELAEPTTRNRWLLLLAATAAVASMWVWWLTAGDPSGPAEVTPAQPEASEQAPTVAAPSAAERDVPAVQAPAPAGTNLELTPDPQPSEGETEQIAAVPEPDPQPASAPEAEAVRGDGEGEQRRKERERRRPSRRRRGKRPGFVADPGF